MKESNQTEDNEKVLTEEKQKKRRKKRWFNTIIIILTVIASVVVGYNIVVDGNASTNEDDLNEEKDPMSCSNSRNKDIQKMIESKTGMTLTAEQLGRKIGVSSQEVNRRLVDRGIAKRIGNNLYPTEEGKELGCFIDKTTRYGYSFQGLEWDECVADYIFTPEEYEAAARREEEIKRIMEGYSI